MCNTNLKQGVFCFVRSLKIMLSMVVLHVYIDFRDVSICRPAENISRQFVHRTGPPIRLDIL